LLGLRLIGWLSIGSLAERAPVRQDVTVSVPLIRVLATFPPPLSRRDKLRQLLWGVFRVVLADPKPAIFAVNAAGYGMLLFHAETTEEENSKLERVGAELDALGPEAWCERYRVPLSFVESLEPPKQKTGIRRFQPLL
jgi:hypothetical protein